MMKTTTLRRHEGGTRAAAGTVARAKRVSAASEGAARGEDLEARRRGDAERWLEAERAIWASYELSDDTRFVLIGNLVTITEHERWKGAWGFVIAARDGRVKVELSSFAADGSVIELPESDVTLDRPATSEQWLLADRVTRLKVVGHRPSGRVFETLRRRSERLHRELQWLQRNGETRTLTHQTAMRRLGITSNHITAIVPWTGKGVAA